MYRLLLLNGHASHISLEFPLDIGIFGPLAHTYRALFLINYQQARKTISHNISGAWRGAGLVPLNPDKVLQRLRPKTPPTASLTDGNGRTVTVDGEAAQRINQGWWKRLLNSGRKRHPSTLVRHVY
ncbi:hypothetical protein B0T24DRAFT_636910 [Lasiosphaeria ovina]|uniref:DDE-1 domain-containing protein n=1 Tax=Lasiosphaeria ovina TaxID=92902 RepID=A0AAE0JWU5_9PEZI|nr:hypothetical protein B0T24DRAFT_636910 [Lasiosphaeria ovina]